MSVPSRLGEFEIEEEIGRGGFGVVHRARQTSLDRPVALKVLYRHLVGTADQVNRFEREARAAARLDHRSLVTVYAWGKADEDFFIAEQLIGRGRTVADLLDDLRESDEPPKGYFRRVAEIVAQVADGLDHAHARGVVHRDVKPSNVLLDDDGAPFLGDFGLAKIEDGLELSRTGDSIGSPYYMAPEQADSQRGPVDARSDIYALGVTLYEMLTRSPPFQGKSAPEIVRRILNDDPRPPSKVDPRVPRDLETICLKAVEKRPDRRYQTAREFAEDLRAFLDGEPISAVPIGSVTRISRYVYKNRMGAGVVVLAVGMMIVVGFLLEAKTERGQLEDTTSDLVENTAQILQLEAEERGFEDEHQRQVDAAIAAGDLDELARLQESYKRSKERFATKRSTLAERAAGTLSSLGSMRPSLGVESLTPDIKMSDILGFFGKGLDVLTPSAINPDAFEGEDETARATPRGPGFAGPWPYSVGLRAYMAPATERNSAAGSLGPPPRAALPTGLPTPSASPAPPSEPPPP